MSRGTTVDWEVLCKHAENIAIIFWVTNSVVLKSDRALSLSWVLRTWKQCHCGTHWLFIRWRQTARPTLDRSDRCWSLQSRPSDIKAHFPHYQSLSVSDCTWTAPSVKLPFAICRQGYTVPMSGSVIYGDITRGGNCQTVGSKWQADLHCFEIIWESNQEKWDGTDMWQLWGRVKVHTEFW